MAPAILSVAVIPAKAGIHFAKPGAVFARRWVPAFAGTTGIREGLLDAACAGLRLDIRSRNSYHRRMKTIVSEKGQITIPKPLRVRLGIRTGQVLDVTEERGRLVMSKRIGSDPFDKYVGILKLGRRTDDIMKELRGEYPLK